MILGENRENRASLKSDRGSCVKGGLLEHTLMGLPLALPSSAWWVNLGFPCHCASVTIHLGRTGTQFKGEVSACLACPRPGSLSLSTRKVKPRNKDRNPHCNPNPYISALAPQGPNHSLSEARFSQCAALVFSRAKVMVAAVLKDAVRRAWEIPVGQQL